MTQAELEAELGRLRDQVATLRQRLDEREGRWHAAAKTSRIIAAIFSFAGLAFVLAAAFLQATGSSTASTLALAMGCQFVSLGAVASVLANALSTPRRRTTQ